MQGSLTVPNTPNSTAWPEAMPVSSEAESFICLWFHYERPQKQSYFDNRLFSEGVTCFLIRIKGGQILNRQFFKKEAGTGLPIKGSLWGWCKQIAMNSVFPVRPSGLRPLENRPVNSSPWRTARKPAQTLFTGPLPATVHPDTEEIGVRAVPSGSWSSTLTLGVCWVAQGFTESLAASWENQSFWVTNRKSDLHITAKIKQLIPSYLLTIWNLIWNPYFRSIP